MTSKETICYAFLLINSFKSHTQGNSAYYFVQNKYQIWGICPQLSKSIVLVVNSAINHKVTTLRLENVKMMSDAAVLQCTVAPSQSKIVVLSTVTVLRKSNEKSESKRCLCIE